MSAGGCDGRFRTVGRFRALGFKACAIRNNKNWVKMCDVEIYIREAHIEHTQKNQKKTQKNFEVLTPTFVLVGRIDQDPKECLRVMDLLSFAMTNIVVYIFPAIPRHYGESFFK